MDTNRLYDAFFRQCREWIRAKKKIGITNYDPGEEDLDSLPLFPDSLDRYLYDLFEVKIRMNGTSYFNICYKYSKELKLFLGPNGYALFRVFEEQRKKVNKAI